MPHLPTSACRYVVREYAAQQNGTRPGLGSALGVQASIHSLPRPSLMCSLPLPATLFAFVLYAASAAAAAQDVFSGSGPWLDDGDRAFRVESLRGSPTVVSMAYGACRRVCSASLRVLEQLQARADARGAALNFVVIGLDPSQDRPADWAAYRAERKLLRANWQFLSGDAKATAHMARRLGVNYWHYGEHVMHDFRIVMVSAGGRIVATMTTPDQGLATLLP